MIDWTKPIETTDGRKAHYIGEVPKECGWRCRRVVMMCDPDKAGYGIDYFDDAGRNLGGSLHNVEPTVEEWQNQYPHIDKGYSWYSTREHANTMKLTGCIGQIKRVRRGDEILDVKFVPLETGRKGVATTTDRQ